MAPKFFGFGKKNIGSSRGDQPRRGSGENELSSGQPSNKKSSDEETIDDSVSQITTSLQSSSIFSKGRYTYGTSGSSTWTDNSSSYDKKLGKRTGIQDQTGKIYSEGQDESSSSVGKPLRVLDYERLTSLNPVAEEEDSVSTKTEESTGPSGILRHTHGSGNSLISKRAERSQTISLDMLETELRRLNENLVALMDDIHQSVINISKAVIQAIEFFKKFLPDTSRITYLVTMANSTALRSIAKIVSHFIDNLLNTDAFQNSKSILLKAYLGFTKKLNIYTFEDPMDDMHTIPPLRNFPIDDKCVLPNRDKLSTIISELVKADSSCIGDQEGAFIAPILRGISKKSAILTVMFGLPTPQHEHYDMVKALFSLFPDVHFFCIKDHIRPCAETLPSSMMKLSVPMETTKTPNFVPPFRVPIDAFSPPISMSLSPEKTQKMTGTLGGYLFPKIERNDSKFSQFSGSAFAITCAHVVLAEDQDYPFVSTPSALLQNTYEISLKEEQSQYSKESMEFDAFSKELDRIDSNLKWQQEHKFGQVVWGERSIVDQSLSDFAIIKVNPKFKVENYLGADLNDLPNPALRFKNMYVKEIVKNIKPGAEVFKIGATSRYTTGKVNGTKLVYWADNRIQSSEFVVSSPQPLFANAGDSGSWVLTKLEGKLGLGVVGMLHSYDGELKQFGLFTPMTEILSRLENVTNVEWDINPYVP